MAEGTNGAAETPTPKMRVLSQYIRDMSFENIAAQQLAFDRADRRATKPRLRDLYLFCLRLDKTIRRNRALQINMGNTPIGACQARITHPSIPGKAS